MLKYPAIAVLTNRLVTFLNENVKFIFARIYFFFFFQIKRKNNFSF